jgi:N utilization substance protein A
MDIKNFTSAMAQIAEEKGISVEKIIESIETAIAAAYKKDYGKKGQIIKAKLDLNTGETSFKQIKLVVTPEMIYSEEELEQMKNEGQEEPKDALGEEEEGKIRFNPEKHILLEEAKEINSKIKSGEELEIHLETKKDYGRIAAQTAKQVVLQKIREAERDTIMGEYKSKEGDIISGIVQRIEGRNVLIDIGKTLGVLPKEEQVFGEFYKSGQRIKVYILKVEESSRGPAVFLSRAYPKLVSKLFELEVPEISQGVVQIKAIAREAGSRSKIAVASTEEGIDPIGSAVGQRGTRVMAVISELGGEKIDIVEYSENTEKFIANSISPAKVIEVRLLEKNKAVCVVQEDQLSLAIGKDGQNVRLAAKLTGWKIDVRTPEKADEEAAEKEKEEGEKEEEKTITVKKGAKEKKEKKAASPKVSKSKIKTKKTSKKTEE